MDLFILQSFLPLFVMTFCICLFIVLMQFLWRYIDDLVGKGLSIDVIGELFFYAALTMVPMALPLAILLASLMIFGNLGEQFELTAMKASGISLLRTMAPLIILMVMIATGAFFFQNDVLPVAQTKMWTLLWSMRQKSPELEIPEGVFYDQIPGYNLFVDHKDREAGTLYSVTIYDVSRGFENSSIILADSGKMSITPDRTHLFLELWSGESFENLKDAASSGMRNVPYRRESFTTKEIMVPFDANFNRMDEQGMRNQYVGKNMAELRATIDSIGERVDSLGDLYGNNLRSNNYMNISHVRMDRDTAGNVHRELIHDVALAKPVNVDSVLRGSSSGYTVTYLNQALTKAQRMRQEYEFKSMMVADDLKSMRRHAIELQKKFTLSFACIIFFFIGAPLGAIIRKGGLGTPLVISVFLFIFYYIIDNMGYKMARDGKVEVWQGMWLSAAVLLPLGIFFTYKAVNDSAIFNKDAYLAFFRKTFGVKETRHYERKDIVMDEVQPALALSQLEDLIAEIGNLLDQRKLPLNYVDYFCKPVPRKEIDDIKAETDRLAERLSNSRSVKVLNTLNTLPVIRSLWPASPFAPGSLVGRAVMIAAPLGLILWLIGRHDQKILTGELSETAKVCRRLADIISTESNLPTQ
ncbi:MAG: LptF/LptG family permease [Duncaniella sp.]|nr:LptF/LptG family permease [Duncaniella sp.]